MTDWLWANYNADKTYAVEITPICPTLENQHYQDAKGRWLINPLVRFTRIFCPLFEKPDETISEQEIEIRNAMANIFFHYLAQMDFWKDFGRTALAQQKIREKLEAGAYGEFAQKQFKELLKEEKYKKMLLRLMLKQQNSSRTYFLEALKTFFPACKAYHYQDEDKYLIYLPYQETKAAKKLLKLVEELFCPITCANKEYFWGMPFAILGQPDTLRIDNCKIY